MSQPDRFVAFRDRNFRLFVVAAFAVGLGGGAQTAALLVEVFADTSDPLQLGLVGLVQLIPMVLLALVGGYIADRFDRKKVVVISFVGTALTSFVLAWLSFVDAPVPWMLTVLGVDAAAVALGRPARAALLVTLVPRELFPEALKWRMSLVQIASVTGPVLGGFLFSISFATAYVFAAFCGLIGAGLIAFTRRVIASEEVGSLSFDELLKGIRFVRRAKVILAAMSLDLFAVLLGGGIYLLPIFKEQMGVSDVAYGFWRAAPAIGAACMAFALAYLPPVKNAGKTMLLAVAGFGVATIVFGFSSNYWLTFAALFFTGFFDNVSVFVRHSLIQMLTPESMRGRVSAVSQVFIGGSNELGGLESGLVARWFGAVFSVVSGGIGCLGVVGITWWRAPHLRNFGSLTEAQPLDENGDPQPVKASE